MKISVSDVAWLVDELEEQLEAGYKWSVFECYGTDREFQHVHLYQGKVKALEYCSGVEEANALWMDQTKVLQKLFENIYNCDKNRSDVDHYLIDHLSLVATRVTVDNRQSIVDEALLAKQKMGNDKGRTLY